MGQVLSNIGFQGFPGFRRFDDSGRDLTTGLTQGNNLSRRSKPRAGPSLLDRTQPYYSGVQRFGVEKWSLYFQDPFHTLLNLPWPRFILMFVSVYLLFFLFFSFLYWAQPRNCLTGITHFSHALWVSSRVSSSIGFSDKLQPNPDCPGTNLLVMANVICSSLVDFIMLGLVFARFSAPYKRATTIRFSRMAVSHRHSSGYWCLVLRVANIRKHQILNPEVKVVLTAVDSITPSNYMFEYLEVDDVNKDQTSLQLGFPAEVTHIIRPGSPMYNLSLQEMEARMMELIVFVDGVDAMTSRQLQARKSYFPTDIELNQEFRPMHLEMRSGKVGLDFALFDGTTPATEDLMAEYQALPDLKGSPMPVVTHHLSHQRHHTFRRLTEAAAAAGRSTRQSDSGEANGSQQPRLPVSRPLTAHGGEVVEMVGVQKPGYSDPLRSEQEVTPLMLQLHALADAILSDASASGILKTQASACKSRYAIRQADTRFEL